MKVGIFETTHFEGTYPVIKLFDDGKTDITVFSYPQAYHQFKYLFGETLDNYHWIIKEKESKIRFIFRIYTEVKKRKIDLLYLNTVTDSFIFYAFLVLALRNVRVVMTLHDINNFFEYKPAWSLRRFVRYVGKKWLIQLLNEFNVVSLTMVSYLRKKLPPEKKIHCLPGAVFEEFLIKSENAGPIDPLMIVVPGTIDEKRRDYGLIFELLEKANRISLPMTVVLLGGHYGEYGKQILKRCSQYAEKKDNLAFYESEVDQPEFDRMLNKAHIVFVPSVIHTVISDGIPETYGISISSGNLFDIIKHAKPFIVPEMLNVDEYLEQSCLRYKNTHQIISFISEIYSVPGKYHDLKARALTASRNYTIQQVRSRNSDLFKTV